MFARWSLPYPKLPCVPAAVDHSFCSLCSRITTWHVFNFALSFIILFSRRKLLVSFDNFCAVLFSLRAYLIVSLFSMSPYRCIRALFLLAHENSNDSFSSCSKCDSHLRLHRYCASTTRRTAIVSCERLESALKHNNQPYELCDTRRMTLFLERLRR